MITAVQMPLYDGNGSYVSLALIDESSLRLMEFEMDKGTPPMPQTAAAFSPLNRDQVMTLGLLLIMHAEQMT